MAPFDPAHGLRDLRLGDFRQIREVAQRLSKTLQTRQQRRIVRK